MMREVRKRHRRSSTASIVEEPEQLSCPSRSHSQIVDFYEGKCVLVTGASGFLGKLLVEKLLRTCTGIRKIFVLIRPKNERAAAERMEELFSSFVFDRLKSDCDSSTNNSKEPARQSFEQLKSKVIVLQGCLEQPYLGLNIERILQLADEVSIIIHSAALISFASNLRSTIEANLLGTRNLLELACKFSKLSAFIYVSTCYSNCMHEHINDHVYPTSMDPDDLLDFARWSSDRSLELWSKQLIGEHPNSYTYTKQMAEYLCAEFATGEHRLPVLICRPSIIVATLREPMRGFLDNRNAGNGVANGVAQGLMQVALANPDNVFDMIPADFVSNCVISLAWFADNYHRVHRKLSSGRDFPASSTSIEDATLERKMIQFYQERKKKVAAQALRVGLSEDLSLVPVVHVSSGVENPITFQESCRLFGQLAQEYPSQDLFRAPGCWITQNYYLFMMMTFLSQTIVGKFMDWFCAPPRPQMVSGGFKGLRRSLSWSDHFFRCHILAQVIAYFVLKSFRFNPDTRLKLIDRFMNDEDRRLFDCDVRSLDWSSFGRGMMLGIRRYLIGEPDKTLPIAKQKLVRALKRNTIIKFATIALLVLILLLCLFR